MKIWKEKRTWTSSDAEEKLNNLEKDHIRKIGVIKHAAFGDLLLTRPFLISLRNFFPTAEINFSAISHYTRGIPEDLVDSIQIIPGRKDRSGITEAFNHIKKFGEHDLLFDLTASTISFYISKFNKAKIKIGFQHHFFHKFIYDIAVVRSQFQFEAETFLDQLHVLGIQTEYPPKFYLERSNQIATESNIIVFPTASNKEKSWSSDNFIILIRKLLDEFTNFNVILLSGIKDWEIDIADKISKNFSNEKRFQLVSGSTELSANIKCAKLLISNDTGIRHLAISLYTPTVGIFFDTPPFRYLPKFGNHKAAYNIDGGEPSVNNVFELAEQIINT